MYQLETNYRGVELTLEFDDEPSASLYINGILRDHVASQRGKVVLRVTSTVQTDYEWHEFIEGVIELRHSVITGTILANKQELVKKEFNA
jgi:hypothetical protein